MKQKEKRGLANPAWIITTKASARGPTKVKLLFYCNDMALELIVNAVEQISSLVRGCRKEGVAGARASTARLELGMKKGLKKVVSSN